MPQGCAALTGSPNSCCLASAHALPPGGGSQLQLRLLDVEASEDKVQTDSDLLANLLADRHACSLSLHRAAWTAPAHACMLWISQSKRLVAGTI
jgi:hypothetical protein